jgi:Na+/melibiose symporter-like transporter
MGTGIITSYRYKITDKRHQEINDAIKSGNANLLDFADVL